VKKVIEDLSLLHIPGNWVSYFLPERVHIFFSLPFITDIPIETLLDALDFPGQLEFYQGFSFANLIPGCSDNFFVFLPGYLSLLPCSVGFLFVLDFVQALPVHPCRPRGVFAQLPLCCVALLLSLEEVILEYSPAFSGLSSLQGFIPWYCTK